jgi:hypothetical protein
LNVFKIIGHIKIFKMFWKYFKFLDTFPSLSKYFDHIVISSQVLFHNGSLLH